ncbi:MAG TPA: DEDD exonuclease domain-containing protein [Egibacteraceae bacterium]|nr:DEDD exonuclease domain-containing protein [Egibacteraceae bacterium]
MSAAWHQPSFTDLGVPLHEVTFVVVDLETTGGSPADCRITEFGAVKTRAGEILGEFQSLVDPGQPIPRSISALTGITDAMVAARPPVEAVLPTFLEFCRGTVLVAHNARFDTGFLNAGLQRLAYPRLDNPVVCTAGLARRLVAEEVRNCKLATLAQFFGCTTLPTHRALADARATVEVFSGLLERAGSFGVVTLEDLIGFSRAGSAPVFASRRRLADGLPDRPGVYAFRSASGEVLYVGKATDLRSRVRSYFGNDERRKIVQMMKEVDAVDHRVCATPLEAAVREVRLIHKHRPRFNRRSKHPERRLYVRLTRERFPRLSIVRAAPTDGSPFLGPLASRSVADRVVEAVQEAVPIRRCTPRITVKTSFSACALAPMGRCPAPCDGSIDPDAYAEVVAPVAAAFTGDLRPIAAVISRRMTRLAAAGRFEEAAAARDRLRTIVTAVRSQRQADAVATASLLVVSRPAGDGVEVAVVRHGRLVHAESAPAADAEAAARRLVFQHSGTPAEPPAERTEEVDVVARWAHGRGAVVHHVDGLCVSEVAGGRDLEATHTRLSRAHRSAGRPASELGAKRRRAAATAATA